MIRIAVVEDEEKAANQLVSYIKKFGKEENQVFEVNHYPDGMSFIEGYSADYDIVFLDIQMPNLNGLDTARKLREIDSDVCLIFVTNMAQYAIKGYEYQAFDFLVKPVEYEFFRMKMEKAVRYCAKKTDAYIVLPDEDGKVKIKLSDVFFIESEKHYIFYHVKDRTYKVRGSLREVENLYIDNNFAQASNTCMVNLAFVEKSTDTGVYVCGEYIPVSRSRKKEFLSKLAICLGAGI